VALTGSPTLAQGREQAAQEVIYRREVYEYRRGGRPDPFRPLFGNAETGLRPEELVLRGVIHHPDPRQSVAILIERSTGRRIRARVGERIGEVRVIAIQPRSVDLLVGDSGATRRFSLHLKSEEGAGS
jgi:hypothetical protein